MVLGFQMRAVPLFSKVHMGCNCEQVLGGGGPPSSGLADTRVLCVSVENKARWCSPVSVAWPCSRDFSGCLCRVSCAVLCPSMLLAEDRGDMPGVVLKGLPVVWL